jgi:hypothetical protein
MYIYIHARKNYEEIEAQKTEFMIAVERQRVVEKGFLLRLLRLPNVCLMCS